MVMMRIMAVCIYSKWHVYDVLISRVILHSHITWSLNISAGQSCATGIPDPIDHHNNCDWIWEIRSLIRDTRDIAGCTCVPNVSQN